MEERIPSPCSPAAISRAACGACLRGGGARLHRQVPPGGRPVRGDAQTGGRGRHIDESLAFSLLQVADMPLSPRELSVLSMAEEGDNVAGMAARLHLTPGRSATIWPPPSGSPGRGIGWTRSDGRRRRGGSDDSVLLATPRFRSFQPCRFFRLPEAGQVAVEGAGTQEFAGVPHWVRGPSITRVRSARRAEPSRWATTTSAPGRAANASSARVSAAGSSRLVASSRISSGGAAR